MPAYASTVTWDTIEEYERHIKECSDEGFTAFKLHAWGDWREDARLARSLRKWTGDDAILMFDGSAGWDLVTALRFGRVLEECGFHWYEEPMREFDLTSYRKLADNLDIPVLAAETSDGVHWNAATWIDMGALDMVRTSSFYKGGLTGALKIAHLAESHGMRAQVHGMGLPNAHLAAAIPNNDFYEQLVYSTDHIKGLHTQHELPIVGGCSPCRERRDRAGHRLGGNRSQGAANCLRLFVVLSRRASSRCGTHSHGTSPKVWRRARPSLPGAATKSSSTSVVATPRQAGRGRRTASS